MIHVANLTKSFRDLRRGQVRAVDDVSFDVRAVRETIERLRSLGKCILYSTHIMREVEKSCDRVAIVSRDRILTAGSMAELRERDGETDLEELFFRLVSV